ncbi:hypothetical protein AAHC03_09746 [Spirometra sp. Aus1]
MAQDCRKWFHNELTGIEAEKLLIAKGVPGSFLVRQSHSNPGNFTLSVRRQDSFAHIRIQNTGDFLSIYGGEKFATLTELVNYYRENRGQLTEKNGTTIDLLYPLFVDDIICESSRWFHGHLTAKEAQNLLLEKGKNGSFLVRESVRQPGSYVLSVVTGDCVSHILICRKPNAKFDIGGGPEFSSLGQLIDYYSQSPMMDKSGGLVCLKQPFNATRLNVSALDKRIAQLEKQKSRGQYLSGFLEEFEELHQDTHEAPRTEGSRPYNQSRNRYKNILPFDSTRVVLRDGNPADPGSDYINANYILPPAFLTEAATEAKHCTLASDHNTERSPSPRAPPLPPPCPPYIATQGVLPETCCDFWRMVWQERSSIIVMLTKETECGRNRCFRYWPTATESTLTLPTYNGTLHVSHISEQNMKTCLVREFNLCLVDRTTGESSMEPLTVHHFQFLAWPEHGTPADPSCFLNFMCHISTQQDGLTSSGPMIVHCSSGIGRTGTFIVIDMLIKCIKSSGLHTDIDIARTVQAVREQRSGMVQTVAQYCFIYKAVQEFVSRLLLRVKLRNALQPYGVDYTNLRPTPSDGCLSCTAPSSLSLPGWPSPPSGSTAVTGGAAFENRTCLGESAPPGTGMGLTHYYCHQNHQFPPALPPHRSFMATAAASSSPQGAGGGHLSSSTSSASSTVVVAKKLSTASR